VRNKYQRKYRKSNHKFEIVGGQELLVRVPLPIAVFRFAATDRSSPVPLPGPRGFVLAVVPVGPSVHRRPRNPIAFPSAHSPRRDLADAEVLLDA
jgi:hypothetical protein